MTPRRRHTRVAVPPVIVPILVLWISSGCSAEKRWKYGPEKEANGPALVLKSLSVPRFLDQRDNANSNLWGLCFVPLLPMGWQDLNTPEGVSMHATSGPWFWDPNRDLAVATAQEVSAAHLFKESFFTERQSEGELIMQGTLVSTGYSSKILTYLLSV